MKSTLEFVRARKPRISRDPFQTSPPSSTLSLPRHPPLTHHNLTMACPRCQLHLPKCPKLSIPHRRAFHTPPSHSRLGAAMYAQEWQTGTYHFNKAHTKTL